jgi:hypothetical protein
VRVSVDLGTGSEVAGFTKAFPTIPLRLHLLQSRFPITTASRPGPAAPGEHDPGRPKPSLRQRSERRLGRPRRRARPLRRSQDRLLAASVTAVQGSGA